MREVHSTIFPVFHRITSRRMRSLYSVPIFIVWSWTLLHGVRGENDTATTSPSQNVTEASGTSHLRIPQNHRQKSKTKRPKKHILQRSWVNLTRSPTNFEKVTLLSRVGLFLHVNENGTVSGSLNLHSPFVKFELQSFGPSIVRVKSTKTKKFLAISSEGLLHTRTDESRDCLFYQNHEENLFVSFASFKYYMKEHYDMFLGIKRNGEVKLPSSTLPGQDSVQFMVLDVDTLRSARKGENAG
ncbi:fibroblast growth factor 1-like [Montipora foliosa]|uniref:fibroblast growth factor 1-like n=1 Tax=Montipora foliosa TaxID=591990 RepID=UPI0035F1C109